MKITITAAQLANIAILAGVSGVRRFCVYHGSTPVLAVSGDGLVVSEVKYAMTELIPAYTGLSFEDVDRVAEDYTVEPMGMGRVFYWRDVTIQG